MQKTEPRHVYNYSSCSGSGGPPGLVLAVILCTNKLINVMILAQHCYVYRHCRL